MTEATEPECMHMFFYLQLQLFFNQLILTHNNFHMPSKHFTDVTLFGI